jgi:integrase
LATRDDAPRAGGERQRSTGRFLIFSEAEIRKLIAHLSGEPAAFTLFAGLTGMRKSEIAFLRWEDVDGGCIRLRAENAKI